MDDTLLADRFEAVVSGAEAGPSELTTTENADLDLLVRLARTIPPASAVVPGPDADFVTALGVRLREEAHRRPAAVPVPEAAPAPARRLRLLPAGRILRWTGGLVAAALIALSVLGVASRQALPGDLLYPVKQLLDRIAVQVSGSHYDKGMTWLAQAEQHIGEARQLIESDDPSTTPHVTSAYDSAANAVRNAEREFALDWQQQQSDRSRLALPDFAATALPLLDAARPDVPEASVPSWQALRDLLAPYALMERTGTITPPGVTPTGLPTGGATVTLPTVAPTGSVTPTVGGSATSTPGLPSPSAPLPTASVPLPTVSVPLPTATIPLPTVSVPLPTVSVPLPTVTLPSATIPLPTVSVPLPTVSVPLPTATLPLPTVSLPLPSVTLPGL